MGRNRHQTGGVRLRSGAWYGYFYLYLQDQFGHEFSRKKEIRLGSQKELQGKKEARALLLEKIQKETSAETPQPDGHSSFAWFWEKRFLSLKDKKWSSNQKKTVIGIFENHVLPIIGKKPLKEINYFDLQMLINSIGEKKSESVTDKAFTYLKAAFDEAYEMDFLEKNPARKLEMPKTKPVCKRHLTPGEIEKLLRSTVGKDRLIIHCLLSLALRPGELFALRWEDLESNQVRIDEQTYRNRLRQPKTEKSRDPVALPASLREEFFSWREERQKQLSSIRRLIGPRDFIFEGRWHDRPMCPRRWQRDTLRPLGKRLGITGLTFQAFRRTFATRALDESKDVKAVQGQMRHTNPQMTAGEYAQVVEESVSRIVEQFDRKYCQPSDGKERVN